MQGKSSDGQQWSVRAQFTISHPGMDDPGAAPQTHTEQDENGLRMSYIWPPPPPVGPPNIPADTHSGSVTHTATPAYGFQKGNLMFTTVPPKRQFSFDDPNKKFTNATNLQDSGYNSELLSPNSCSGNRNPSQPCNRRCRSTCSITLSTTINEQPEVEEKPDTNQQSCCGRAQSLRCQTPSVRCDRASGFFGCGDPWCYHSMKDPSDGSGRFSPVRESDHSQTPSRSNTLTRQEPPKLGRESQNRLRDAAVQTTEMVDKCTSPYLKIDSFAFKDQETQDSMFKKEKVLKKRSSYNARSRTEPVFTRAHSPSSFTPDSLDSSEHSRRLFRNPGKLIGRSPFLSDKQSSASESKSSDPTKKPRTVHIDVYCTGTEQESEDSESNSDIDSKTASSPQTVFESERVRITHSRSIDADLPQKLKESASGSKLDVKSVIKEEEIKGDSDNDDNTSTAYPSQISSYSAIPGLSSFSSSVPPSWSTYSMSVDDYDSVANTSWKDTFSDIESLNRSRSSIAPTDSLDFVPRRLIPAQKSESIEEHPEERKTLDTPSVASLKTNDSFEYANSDDKLRIRRMEHLWKKPGVPRQWRSPHLDRKHLLQQQKLKEYVENRLSSISIPKSESKDSDSASDSSEKGWSFVKDDDKKLERDVTVRRAIKEGPELVAETREVVHRRAAVRSPSVMAIQEKLHLNPSLRSPFMIVPGIFTEQRQVARKFGSVVDVFKKPGHHIGPAKNPECQCDHCRSYYENGGRGRARSVGEVPVNYPWRNWRISRMSQPRD